PSRSRAPVLRGRERRQDKQAMPLVKRPIPSSLSLAAPELYSESRGNEVLDDVNMAGMVGTLTQLGALAVYAHEMFSELCSVADELAGRVVEMSSRTSTLMADLTHAEEVTARVIGKEMGIDDNAVVEAMKAERQAATRAEAAMAQTVFLARTMPPGLVERYHSSEVRPMPALAEIDALISNEERQRMRQERGVESCTQLYSDPNLFYHEWERLERERQDKISREKQQRKEERRARKKKKEAAVGSGDLSAEAFAAAGIAALGGGPTPGAVAGSSKAAKRQLDFRSRAGGGLSQRRSLGGGGGGSGHNLMGLVSQDTLVVDQGDTFAEHYYQREEDFAGPSYDMPAPLPTPPPRPPPTPTGVTGSGGGGAAAGGG
ncbi:unnamed protein product, partial [Phaeothamnion confervicola]